MNRPSPALPTENTDQSLRQAVLAAYISSSRGIHRSVSPKDFDDYTRAYRWYLRGWIPAGAGKSWLDLGCGQGQLLKLATESGFAARGVDASQEMLASAERLGLQVGVGDAFATLAETPTASLDCVSAFDLVEHFVRDDGFRLLTEMHRILKPGGYALLKLPNAASPFGAGITADDLTHEAAYTPQTIVQLALVAGFSAGEVRELGPTPLSFSSRFRRLAWRIIAAGCSLYDTIETGRSRSSVYTRVMLVRLDAQAEMRTTKIK